MAKARIKLNNKGFKALRTAPGVKQDLNNRAKRVADAAGPGFEAHEAVGRNRARAVVGAYSNTAKRRQSKDNVLQRALSAGR